MSVETDSTDDTDPFEDGPLTPQRLAAVFGTMDIVMFAVVGYFLFEDPLLGGLAGLFVGGGVFLFLPSFLVDSDADEGRAPSESDPDGHPLRSFHRVAAGLGLSAGGIILLSVVMIEEPAALALGIALLVAAVLYVPLALVLPNPTP